MIQTPPPPLAFTAVCFSPNRFLKSSPSPVIPRSKATRSLSFFLVFCSKGDSALLGMTANILFQQAAKSCLNAAIKRLRGALNDSARAPRYVETLAKRGYLFVAPLAAVFSPSDTVALEARKPQSDSRKLSKLHRWRLWLSVATVMLAAPLAGWNWRSSLRRIVTPSRSPVIRPVAVLPLENLSGDASQEHLADGVTDAAEQVGEVRCARGSGRFVGKPETEIGLVANFRVARDPPAISLDSGLCSRL